MRSGRTRSTRPAAEGYNPLNVSVEYLLMVALAGALPPVAGCYMSRCAPGKGRERAGARESKTGGRDGDHGHDACQLRIPALAVTWAAAS